MTLSAPNKILWLIAVILGIIGALGGFSIIAIPYAFALLFIGWILLVIGTAMKGI